MLDDDLYAPGAPDPTTRIRVPTTPQEPNEATRRRAEMLNTHKYFRQLIADYLKMPGWPRNDRSSFDRMEGYTPEQPEPTGKEG